jgi:hypothetical protein
MYYYIFYNQIEKALLESDWLHQVFLKFYK